MILFLFVVNILVVNGVKEWERSLNRYFCNKWSPVLDSEKYVSKTDPPVAITHIFCGEVKGNGSETEVEGFHSRPSGRNPRSAYIAGPVTYLGRPSTNCPYTTAAENVMVRHARDGKYYPRNKTSVLFFFPRSWGKQSLVDRIVTVYKDCTGAKKRCCVVKHTATGHIDSICKNYKYPNCSKENLVIKLFISWQDGGYHIVSAFPDNKC